MKRSFDVFAGIILLVILSSLMILISIAILLTSKGPILHWSNRIGKENQVFKMPKFRSMQINTPQLATHLIKDPDNYLSPVGGFLRAYSLDELPQIYSVLKGDMSFVGPRPALFNQKDLIELRSELGIQKLSPGITGWAQINGRDELSIIGKVKLDEVYLKKKSFYFDMKILFITVFKIFIKDGVRH